MKLEITVHLDSKLFDATDEHNRNDYVSGYAIADVLKEVSLDFGDGPFAVKIGDRGKIHAPTLRGEQIGEWKLV